MNRNAIVVVSLRHPGVNELHKLVHSHTFQIGFTAISWRHLFKELLNDQLALVATL